MYLGYGWALKVRVYRGLGFSFPLKGSSLRVFWGFRV